MTDEFGLGIKTAIGFDRVVLRARVALRAHGFSILSEMPAPAAIGESGRRHLFMGVWEKPAATGNLGGPGLDVGDHVVCNVVIYEEENFTVVAGLDPEEGLEGWAAGVGGREASQALQRALEQIAASPELDRP
ncbi:MAG: hypothetical protein M3164_05060 [Actinomycetota bacterium]|nr:hypothetical protein [Actinomycetota bacterium]